MLLAVQTQGSVLGVRSQALVVLQKGRVVQTIRPHDVREVHLYGEVGLSAAARTMLLGLGVEVLLLTRRGFYRGRMIGSWSPHAERRAAQYRTLSQPDQALALARAFVRGKLHNQRHLLERGRRNRRGDAQVRERLQGAIVALRRLEGRLEDAQALAQLMGFEGMGAALYFEGFGELVTAVDVHFERRTRRPPRDPVNACLSFGYMLLLRRVEAALWRAGLDPSLGALHEPLRGRPSLALDLMEEFRPVAVDRVVLSLFNRRQLRPADFVTAQERQQAVKGPGQPPKGQGEVQGAGWDEAEEGVYLGPEGRSIFLRTLYQQWRTLVPYVHGGAPRLRLEQVVEQQAYKLVRALGGECEYAPFLMSG